ncbi:hypothetical protein BJ138DRAFT_1116026 [Hygrophoropsis aurantiaca]|uniref:Uncharacterized protein n=1 Tax=Hygrophoropsis aurantiaca TaxID=72124 RepID=A0ACB8A4T2_9AGAM|nr:hypothetical protein BJ138DRAFT_1116026 [Hygrophoropsis aurantiaca]
MAFLTPSVSSGVGPENHPKEHGIPVMKDLPGVGSNLQDHVAVPLQFRVPLSDSLAKLQLRPWIIIKLMFLHPFFGTGLLLAPVLELSIFLQSRLFDAKSRTVITCSTSDIDSQLPRNLPDIEIMPGTVRLASSDPSSNPIIDPKYFSAPEGWNLMRQAIRFTFSIRDQLLLQKYNIFDAHVPASVR